MEEPPQYVKFCCRQVTCWAAGQKLTLKLGFSHDTVYTVPDSMRAFLQDPTTIGLYGIDKEQVCSGTR